jgi:hypothetical protein
MTTNIDAVKIHDIVVKGYERQFTLTITPLLTVPEPATLTMLGVGMMTLGGYTVLRKNQRRRRVKE